MTERVVVAGQGLLAAAISERLNSGTGPDVVIRACDVPGVANSPPDGRLLITANDGWDCRGFDRIQALCAAHRMYWLPVRTELGRAVLGPLHVPGESGCVRCAELRRSVADKHSAARDSVRQKYPRLADQPSPWLTAAAARTVAALTADEVAVSGSRSGRARQALLFVDLDTLAVSAHRFLPDPLCPLCGACPDDDQEAARITLNPQPVPAPGAYRIRPLGDADADALRATYVDEQTGLIQHVEPLASGGLAVAAAAMRTRYRSRAEL